MARTESKMIKLGTKAPDFSIFSPLEKRNISLSSLKKEKATLIMFLSVHCPFVKHLNKQLSLFAKEFMPQGLGIIAINSNDIEQYPEDSRKYDSSIRAKWFYISIFIWWNTRSSKELWSSVYTWLFLYDGDLELRYRGQFDNSRPGNNNEITGKDLRLAVTALLNDKLPSVQQFPSVGCNIKWK